MTRTQTILGGILLVQLALIMVLRSPFSDASAGATPELLLPQLEAITPVRVELVGAEEGQQVELSRDGETWRVDSLDGFPADKMKVDTLLTSLKRLRVRRPVVSSSRYHDTFKVKQGQSEGEVRVWDADSDAPDADLIIGNSPNYRLLHIRQAADDRVYEAQGLAAYDLRAEASDWIDKELVEPDEFQIIGLTLQNTIGSLELEKEAGQWVVRSPTDAAGTTLDPQKVAALVRAAASLRLSSGVGAKSPEHGLDDAPLVLTLRWTESGADTVPGESVPDAQELTIRVGGAVTDNESQRYVSRDGTEFTGAIWESSVKPLMDGSAAALAAS